MENNFIDLLGGALADIGETAGDIIISTGDNFESNAETNAALADRLKIQNSLAVSNNAKEQARKDKQQDLIVNIAYAVVAVLLLFAASNIYRNFKK